MPDELDIERIDGLSMNNVVFIHFLGAIGNNLWRLGGVLE